MEYLVFLPGYIIPYSFMEPEQKNFGEYFCKSYTGGQS